MKTITKKLFGSFSITALVVLLAGLANAQTSLQFTGISTTDEGNILLTWSSVSYEVYQIQCADALNTNADGSTTWNELYSDYPSQGTNTFWLDTGNYFNVPTILSPKYMPMRFYRIVDKGPDELIGNEPTVSIISPTSGSVVSGLLTITVTATNASTEQGNVYPKLYVDGQVMWPSMDGSNYVINTCEWGNGLHVLFATADALTQPDGPSDSVGLSGHAVSPFVNVTFSNLVTEISFSQEFFQPSLGQTQQVSADFAANSDWTLQIEDINSNIVLTATGSGTSMLYNWDGTGTGETNLPDGNYYYYISAQTNGNSDGIVGGGSGGSTNPPPLGFSSDASELWAVSPNSVDAVPLMIYPPGLDTNNLTIFSATPSEMATLRSSLPNANAMDSGNSFSPMDSSADDYSGASAQSAPPAPTRPPTTPSKGEIGKIGVAYQMYNANGTNPTYVKALPDGSGIYGEDVHIYNPQGLGANQNLPVAPFHKVDLVAINFISEMEKGGWGLGYLSPDSKLQLSDLQGSGTPFNNVDIGLLIVHGAYGISYDYTTGHPLYGIYFPIASGNSAQYLRMTDMNLGGSSPNNGLKWMAIMACTSLYQHNWKSIISQNAKPYNSNLHMILGTGTDFGADPLIGQYWADYMLGNPAVGRKPMTIQDAWYNAAYQAYTAGVNNGVGNYPNPIIFAVVSDPNCVNDTLQIYSAPSGGTWTYNSWTVFPLNNPPPTQ
jgi:hypothetical protein